MNPDIWFDNVERIVAERVGRETVQYLSNIYKYFVAYTLVQDDVLQPWTSRSRLADYRALQDAPGGRTAMEAPHPTVIRRCAARGR